jgi:hypothetical protein
MNSERWARIEGIYNTTLERPRESWSAFLDEQVQGDEELKRELESLLETSSSSDDFFERGALETAAQALRWDRSESLLGRSLNHYRIGEKIGIGGMAEVYRAHDTKLALHTMRNGIRWSAAWVVSSWP